MTPRFCQGVEWPGAPGDCAPVRAGLSASSPGWLAGQLSPGCATVLGSLDPPCAVRCQVSGRGEHGARPPRPASSDKHSPISAWRWRGPGLLGASKGRGACTCGCPPPHWVLLGGGRERFVRNGCESPAGCLPRHYNENDAASLWFLL